MRLIIGLLSAFLTVVPASALTLYNSQDPKTQSASSKASEQLNHAFSTMFEVLAAIERRSLGDADKLKGEAVGKFQEAAKLFTDAGQQASDEKVLPVARDDEDKQTIKRMLEFSLEYKTAYNTSGELSERLLFTEIGRVLREFAGALSELPSSAFAKDLRDQRLASQFLRRAIRLQEFGRVTTAYLAIPRK